MKTLRIESLAPELQQEIRSACTEPLVVTEDGAPAFVVRSLLEDDVADDLIARSPSFRKSIEEARRQKARGETKTIEEVRKELYDAAEPES